MNVHKKHNTRTVDYDTAMVGLGRNVEAERWQIVLVLLMINFQFNPMSVCFVKLIVVVGMRLYKHTHNEYYLHTYRFVWILRNVPTVPALKKLCEVYTSNILYEKTREYQTRKHTRTHTNKKKMYTHAPHRHTDTQTHTHIHTHY